MTSRAELRNDRDAHGVIAVKLRGLLGECMLTEISDECAADWQSEVLDALEAIATHCEDAARYCDDQAALQSSDRAMAEWSRGV